MLRISLVLVNIADASAKPYSQYYSNYSFSHYQACQASKANYECNYECNYASNYDQYLQRHWTQVTYKQLGKGLNGHTNDWFGYSMSFSGDITFAIGARQHGGPGPGYVKIYMLDEGRSSHILLQTITGSGNGDWFGYSLSLSLDSSTLAVGALYNDSKGYKSAGLVSVYKLNEATSTYWHLTDFYGDKAGDRFGHSVSLSADGSLMAVGLTQFDTGRNGQAKVYQWNAATSTYNEIGDTLEGDTADDSLGDAVIVSSDGITTTVFVAATQFRNGGPGYIKIYELTGSNFIPKQTITGESDGDAFGIAMSLSEDSNTLVVGASSNGKKGSDSGQAQVFQRHDSESTFKQIGQFDGAAAGDRLGDSVAISADADIIAIAATQYGNGGSGYVKLYKWETGTSTYRRIGKPLIGSAGDQFGLSVSLAGENILAIGAPYNDRGGSDSGEVNVFRFN